MSFDGSRRNRVCERPRFGPPGGTARPEIGYAITGLPSLSPPAPASPLAWLPSALPAVPASNRTPIDVPSAERPFRPSIRPEAGAMEPILRGTLRAAPRVTLQATRRVILRATPRATLRAIRSPPVRPREPVPTAVPPTRPRPAFATSAAVASKPKMPRPAPGRFGPRRSAIPTGRRWRDRWTRVPER